MVVVMETYKLMKWWLAALFSTVEVQTMLNLFALADPGFSVGVGANFVGSVNFVGGANS